MNRRGFILSTSASFGALFLPSTAPAAEGATIVLRGDMSLGALRRAYRDAGFRHPRVSYVRVMCNPQQADWVRHHARIRDLGIVSPEVMTDRWVRSTAPLVGQHELLGACETFVFVRLRLP